MKFVCGNFKMNGSLSSILTYTNTLNTLDSNVLKNVCVCFPTPFLLAAKNALFSLGGQNCHQLKDGAYTGETSAKMLADCGCKYVLVGHSERRKYNSEDDKTIYMKAIEAHNAKLTPIVCIGENESQIDKKYDVLRRQIMEFNPKVYSEENFSSIMFAYEPVWAIGTGRAATLQEIHSTCEFISETLIKIFGNKIPVLYGGSVSPKNAESILEIKTIDGVLVGGNCLAVDKFEEIINVSARMDA